MPRVQKRSLTSPDNNGQAHTIHESSRQSYKVAARSCQGCHERKVRCDRGVPCTNCSKCGFTCVYPTKNSELNRKSATLQNISNRLERLEALLSRLVESGRVVVTPESAAGGGSGGSGANINATANQHPSDQHSSRSTWELLLNDGQVFRYVNNLNIEILLQDEERTKVTQYTGSETVPLHLQKSTDAYHPLLAQPSACAPSDMVSDVLEFYPYPRLALQLWTVYVNSVDPVLKILHIPTAQSAVVSTIMDPKSAGSSNVALTFAIYFAAVTALGHGNKNEHVELPSEKPLLLKRYKMALDRLLMVTDLMNRPELTALQALAIYVTCLRAHETGRSVWVLNGLAIRLAQSIGVHRDGACLQLSPFETEMRLRLWWHLCVLDSRAPEDQGFATTVDVMNRGLRLPLNVNDNQIYPDMTSFPIESDGWTEMSFFLIQTDSCRLLHPVLETQGEHPADALPDITAKRKIIQEHGRYLSTKYGLSSGSGTPTDLSRIAIQHVTTGGNKMEFVLQLREEIITQKQKGTQGDATPDILKPSFKLACEGLESKYMLLKESPSRFEWFFNMYTPWYALAYVLRCLCSSPSSPYEAKTERAWALVEELFPRRMSLHDHSDGHGSISRCLNLLRFKALSLRQHAQLTTATADVEAQFSSSGERCTSQLRPNIEIPPPASTTATAHGASTIPELSQEFIADPNQNIFSSLDLSMSEIPFLPDWNAVINGCLDNDGQ